MDESAVYNNTQSSLLNLSDQSSTGVSPLEQEVLDEYERLSRNMKEVSLTACVVLLRLRHAVHRPDRRKHT
jgi:hypothetical protein